MYYDKGTYQEILSLYVSTLCLLSTFSLLYNLVKSLVDKSVIFCNIHIKNLFFLLNLIVYGERSGIVNAQKILTHGVKKED